jgi:two-component system, sensor histidine kinase and response regulator
LGYYKEKMKTTAKNTKEIPVGLRKTVQIIETLHDLVLLFNMNGAVIYQGSSGYNTEAISSYIKNTGASQIEARGKHQENFSSDSGEISIIFSVIKHNKEKFIICTGSINTLKSGLLWDSFFIKNNISYSQMAVVFTGYTSEELNKISGKGFGLLTDEDSEEVKEKISGFIIGSKQELELIYRAENKSGRQLWLREFIYADRDVNGNITGYECSLQEVTPFMEEKKEMSSRLKDLYRQNREKDQFLSVLSHDLKSPYTSILGFSEILLNESSLTPEERTEYLSYINLSSQTQLKLINNLLEWSRLITGRKKIEKVKLNVKNLVESVISNNTRNICKKGLGVRVTADNYMFAEADERLITEVITIIVGNAVKYSYPEKIIEIYINFFRDNQIEVIVKDEGTGISEKNKGRLLKIDQVFSTPGTSGERGTGISLLLANEIIKTHNGELWFYSEEGRGTEFHITMPSAGNTILLLSNNETEKLKVANMVKTGFPDFRFVTGSNFYDALKLTAEMNPSVIIATHLLPLMNGLEFLKTLRSEFKFAHIPVIISSDDINDEIEASYRNLGVTGLLSEPLNLITLKGKIENILK